MEPGDLLLFAADTYEVASAVLSALRLHMADALDVPREGHQLLWVVNFPMFKYDEDEKKYAAEHHPFTHVLDEDVDKIESDPLACGSYSYDLVMDGFEVGGGTIRIHNADEQRAVLRTCGLTDEEIEEKFRMARSLGFDNINMDLIMGLPGEDLDDVKHTLEEIEALKPDSLTVHSLAIKRAARLNMFKEEYADLKISNTPEMIAFINECLKS